MDLDLTAFRWINDHRHPVLDGVLGAVTALGELSAVWLLACGAMYFFGRQEHKRAAIVFMVALLILDGVIAGTIKMA